MEQTTNNPTKSKFPDLLNGAIITLLITALVVAFSFAYNAGYNSYYGLPLFITNTTVLGLLEKTLLLSDAFGVLILIALICIFIFRLIKYWIDSGKKNKNSPRSPIRSIAMFIVNPIFLIVSVACAIIYKSTTMLITTSVYFILWIFGLVFFLKTRKLHIRLQEATDKSKELSSDSEIQDGFTNEVIKLSKDTIKLENFSKTMPTSKTWLLPPLLFIFAALFTITFSFGKSSAKQQEVYYFSDQSHVVIGTYSDKAILVCVSKDLVNNSYFVTGEYALSSFDSITLVAQNCGTIFSKYYESNKLETIETFG